MVDGLVYGFMSLKHIDFDKVKSVSHLQDFLETFCTWIAKREVIVGTMFSSFCDHWFYFCSFISVEHLLSVSDHSFIHSFTCLTIMYSQVPDMKQRCVRHECCLQRPPIFKTFRSLAIKPFILSVSVLQILSYLVTLNYWPIVEGCCWLVPFHLLYMLTAGFRYTKRPRGNGAFKKIKHQEVSLSSAPPTPRQSHKIRMKKSRWGSRLALPIPLGISTFLYLPKPCQDHI